MPDYMDRWRPEQQRPRTALPMTDTGLPQNLPPEGTEARRLAEGRPVRKFTNMPGRGPDWERIDQRPDYIGERPQRQGISDLEPYGFKVDDPATFNPEIAAKESLKKDMPDLYKKMFGDVDVKKLTDWQKQEFQKKLKQLYQRRLNGARNDQRLAMLRKQSGKDELAAKDMAKIRQEGYEQYYKIHSDPVSGALMEDAPPVNEWLEGYVQTVTGKREGAIQPGGQEGGLTGAEAANMAKRIHQAAGSQISDAIIAGTRKKYGEETAQRLRQLAGGGKKEAIPEKPRTAGPGGGYGKRADGTQKGKGYFGELKRPDGGVSTEISIGVEFDGKETEIPTLVPTLTKEEVQTLLNWKKGEKIPENIVKKAVEHARKRIAEGKSPFAQKGEQKTIPGGGEKKSAIPRGRFTEAPSAEEKAKAKQELADFANKIGLGPDNWKEAAKTLALAGGFTYDELLGKPWREIQRLAKQYFESQQRSRTALPAYGG